jgi:hypothetical protein
MVNQEGHQRIGIDHHHEDQQSSATSSSFVYTALLDENKCLKNENELLSCELGKTKKKCKQLILHTSYLSRESYLGFSVSLGRVLEITSHMGRHNKGVK